MGALAEIILSFLNLLEAEGKALRAGIVKAAIALALALVVGALFMVALGLMIGSLYLYLRMLPVSQATAALLAGLFTLLLAGVVLWIIRKSVR